MFKYFPSNEYLSTWTLLRYFSALNLNSFVYAHTNPYAVVLSCIAEVIAVPPYLFFVLVKFLLIHLSASAALLCPQCIIYSLH